MKRVAEIIHIVAAQREEFLHGALNPDEETLRVLWLCGVRKQQYFELGELIFMTFEYEGSRFAEDMARMTAYLDARGHLVKLRRRDVPVWERESTNWWAPVKRLASILDRAPVNDEADEAWQTTYNDMIDGCMNSVDVISDTVYDEDDWSQGITVL